ncbi:MAG: bifunctional chorismate mutase/prephenate dehydratase [Oscillospiraceae bacterium]|nr:bifunctional chorismate mutase/prephenate dehydratase [Oscillospiraceae bacterium]
MDLKDLREQIDNIDNEIVRLFQERMRVAADVAEYKKANGKAILDKARERQKLNDIVSKTDEEFKSYTHVLYSLMFELSRSYQGRLLNEGTELQKRISDAVENTERLFPRSAEVACQGVEGAYSQIACEKMFSMPNIMYFNNFEGVFAAIEQGLCRYGVLPLENSTAGSVNKIYDLMIKYDFNIVRSTRLKVDHNLLVKKGTKLEDIKAIYSHEQAISQCSEFLKKLTGVKVIACENTAVAAKMVAESPRGDIAALSSRSCAELYSLGCLAESVQDKGNNYTRFICISKKLEIYPGADKTSIMIMTDHKPGALYKLLSRFYALDINLTKLESRPLPDRDFEFMFYFDLETSVYSPEFITLIGELESSCEQFRYLGSYSEMV